MRERLETINQRIAAACQRAGRDFSEVTLVAVSKTVAPPLIRQAIEAGVRVLGENRVQEAATKIPELEDLAARHNVAWHLIGHLQSNKARRAVELFSVVQSVDSFKLAARLDGIAGELGKRLPVFLEINLGGEDSKAGVSPNEVLPLCEQVSKLAHLELKGLMAVPPFLDDPEQVRPFFRRLRHLRDEALQSGIVGESFRELSMGMSNDFEVAIEEGATLVRVGTALFGSRS
ncbi:MAG TPA: YggS family pyridoxal phosphate-dependent enzyme [Blastocatellia bacterium]|nr:YggS family pyridoxal phosphate-dependent enzyme [Blastocatellia bacterium]HMV82966.1 YggS family pyridoxal phosphate-dependent enzyme [Blastocatellia bacterium]HMX26085.1 YggS family pyridoxal phosphate-dependent enzyme [Blastocatellia bacterium]HMY73526.1 YggS family pyridoxal phosphate-dependent enzyme [Blastocatellia bacterium]HMZ17621.1 YggS family pyridoxal phosphate-dependent enzyme [Blastocatellia bacterium]